MENSEISRYCKFLRSKLPEWKDLADSEINFHLFNSITNKVYKATPTRDDIIPECVILRNFCGEEGIVDLEKEMKVFDGMSECGAGPRCFGKEDDLRIEEYIPARIILAEEYKQKLMRRKLARATAAMHKIVIPGVDNETLFGHALKTPTFFGLYDKKCSQDIYSQKEKQIIDQVKTASDKTELEFIERIIPKDDNVLSHNDLLAGNVLITEEKEDVRFIDYEYASYNFRGYDMGNMFREATVDYTYPEDPCFTMVEANFPNEEEFRDYIRYYIAYTDMDDAEQKKRGDDLINNDESMKKYLEENYRPEELKRREDVLYREAKIGTMLSFYYWLIWAVKMFQTNDSPFNYLEFARVCHDNYLRLKKDILADEKN